jgi:hypothetical protein
VYINMFSLLLLFLYSIVLLSLRYLILQVSYSSLFCLSEVLEW